MTLEQLIKYVQAIMTNEVDDEGELEAWRAFVERLQQARDIEEVKQWKSFDGSLARNLIEAHRIMSDILVNCEPHGRA